MQGRGPRENIPKKVYICEFFKGFNLCFVSARSLRNVCTFYIWFLIHGLVLELICKFIISHNNFQKTKS